MPQLESLLTRPAWKLSHNEYEQLLQEHWGKIRDLHFGEGGTPYWLERAKHYGIKPKKNLFTVFDFLSSEISLCDEDELREKPLTYFIPQKVLSCERGNIHPFTSSGTIGKKKPHAWSFEAIEYCAMFYEHILDLYEVEKDLDWFSPGTYGLFPAIMERVIGRRGGMFYFIPIEPRDLKKHLSPHLLSNFDAFQSNEFLMARVGPIIETSFDILARGIDVFGTILPVLAVFENAPGFERVKVVPLALNVEKESYTWWKDKLRDKTLYNTYGNSCAGLFPNIPGGQLIYYPPSPVSLIFVVNENNPFRLVEYGERGSMRILKMDKAFLWCQIERDCAKRVASRNEFKWDGIEDIISQYF